MPSRPVLTTTTTKLSTSLRLSLIFVVVVGLATVIFGGAAWIAQTLNR